MCCQELLKIAQSGHLDGTTTFAKYQESFYKISEAIQRLIKRNIKSIDVGVFRYSFLILTLISIILA